MSSFTSVFKTDEGRVMIAVLIVLGVVEVFLRTAGHRLSQDVVATQQIVKTAAELAAAPKPRLLIVGNSMAREGIDPALLESELKAAKGAAAPSVFIAYPDSSHALVWDYLLEKYFVRDDSKPDEVLLVTGRQHLLDSPSNHASMGASFVSWAATPRYLRDDAQSFDGGAEFLLGRLSSTYSMRARVSPRVFSLLLPHYEENWVILNRAALAGRGVALSGNVYDNVTTRHFEHLAKFSKEKGVRLTVVAAPLPYRYEIVSPVQRALKQLNVPVVDLNPVAGIDARSFSDADHLNAAGKTVFTRALAKALAK